MERLMNIKNSLVSCVESQINNLERANAHELGEVIDMIKDIEESIYYCSIVKAMDSGVVGNKIMYYTETNPKQRYLEAKHNQEDKVTSLKELEAYMNDLSVDIIEMINDASTDEKQYLEKKMM